MRGGAGLRAVRAYATLSVACVLGAFFVARASASSAVATARRPDRDTAKAQGAYALGLQRAGIAPYSHRRSDAKPHAACPPPRSGQATCLAAVVPEKLAKQHRAFQYGPRLEGSGQRGGYSPSDLRSAYHLRSEGGSGLTIAITVAHDYPTAEADLAVYRETYGLPPCTTANGCFQKVNQRGEAGSYPGPAEGWSAEAALDLDMTSAICPECQLVLVEAENNSDERLAQAVSEAASLGANVISDSWGGPEFPEETAVDPYLDHPGVPVLFASGDSSYGAEYPASSPNVIAVGGTSLSKDGSARGWRETAWSGAGSGCSLYEEKPTWQSDSGCANRSVADVSAVADPSTPVSVYDTYGNEYQGWLLFGGTSVATPIMAGVEALLGSLEREEGAALFWKEGSEGKLFDLGEGRNGSCSPDAEYLCHAELGYDGPTGWGTPGASRPSSPAVATYDPTAVHTTEATLNGAVNPNGEETTYRFEYRTSGSSRYTASVPVPDEDAGSGTEPLVVKARLSGLKRNATYHYRLVAESASGVTYGGDRTFETSLWSAEYLPRTEQQRERMLGVSCPSASLCVAVGSQGVYYEPPMLPFNDEPLVERWDGSRWLRETVPVLHPAAAGYYSLLASVSCVSSESCMAVGENYELPSGYQPLAERWDGSSWSIAPMPMPSDAPPNTSNGQRSAKVHGVSCAASDFCIAVGQFARRWDSGTPEEIATLVERWDGGSWAVVPSPEAPGAEESILRSVSCLSETSCVAVGEISDAQGARRTLIERWDGAQWSVEAAPALAGGLEGISCSSQSSCMAVGGTEGQSGGDGVAETWDGSSWTAVSLGWSMRGVSCLAADWCVAAGGDSTAHADFGAIWDGARWLMEDPVSPVDSSDIPKEINGVSCEPSSCEAVGWYWSWGYRPLAERLDRSLVAPRPTVANDPAGAVTQSGAILNGHVDNNGGVGNSDEGDRGGSDCRFEVALKTAPSSPVAESVCTPHPVEGDSALPVEALVKGLQPDTEYVYRLVASNEGGTATATPDAEFQTAPSAPMVANGSASAVTRSAATLSGQVDNEGAAGGSGCKFMVARAGSPTVPMVEAPCSPDPVSGDVSTAVQASVTGLEANARYVFWIVATNSSGSSTGTPAREFSTLPNPPAVANRSAGAITQTTALLSGRVDNEGAASGTRCKFVVALDRTPDSPVAEPACDPNPVTGEASTSVQAEASGLRPNVAYVFRLEAESSGGESTAAPDQGFTTLPNAPRVAEDSASAITQTSAKLHGRVDNDGAALGTTCRFTVAVASSPSTVIAEPPCSQSQVDGEGYVGVEAQAGGLQPNTSYVYRLVAESEGGVSEGTPGREFRTTPEPPVAAFSTTPYNPVATEPVRFQASGPSAAEGTISSYGWDFGDGERGGGAAPTHVYAEPGTYAVTLRVSDAAGLDGEAYRVITVGPAANGFVLHRTVALCDGRIVLLLGAPGAGSFSATAKASPLRQRAAKSAQRTVRRGHCGGRVGRGALRGHLGPRDGQHPRNSFLYGQGSRFAHAAGTVRLAIRPRHSALKSLRTHGSLMVRITVRFDPDGGSPTAKHVMVAVHRLRVRRNSAGGR